MRMGLKTASLLFVIIVTVVFSARSLAASGFSTVSMLFSEEEPKDEREVLGTLTATGHVTVNGNEARTGATILNGSRVATGPDGDALIDLRALGRIQLRPDTEIKLILASGSCQVEIIRCGSLTQTVPAGVSAEARRMEPGLMEVAVLPGEANVESVNSDDQVVIKSGENRVFNEFERVMARGETTLTLNCCDCEIPAAGFILPLGGWWGGAAALTGAAVGVGVGVDTGDEDPPVSFTAP